MSTMSSSSSSSTQSPLQRASFAAATAASGYLLYKSLVPPRPVQVETAQDPYGAQLMGKLFASLALYRGILFGSSLLNAATALSGGDGASLARGLRSLTSGRVGPLHPSHVDARFVSWTAGSAGVLALIAASAAVRLRAMRELGDDFTFDLHDPQRLFTGGVYAYVQHPSYSTAMVASIAGMTWFVRANGPLGAFLSPETFAKVRARQRRIHVVLALMVIVGLRIRVYDEEKMLRARFGREWEEWSAKTARFIPFLF